MGAPRHRWNQRADRRREGRHRSTRAAAHRVSAATRPDQGRMRSWRPRLESDHPSGHDRTCSDSVSNRPSHRLRHCGWCRRCGHMPQLAGEDLFLQPALALYVERRVKQSGFDLSAPAENWFAIHPVALLGASRMIARRFARNGEMLTLNLGVVVPGAHRSGKVGSNRSFDGRRQRSIRRGTPARFRVTETGPQPIAGAFSRRHSPPGPCSEISDDWLCTVRCRCPTRTPASVIPR